MAEPRRLEFTTIAPKEKEKKKDLLPMTQRFCLTLTDTTETTCPEFSYTELMKNAARENRENGGDSSDPFGENGEQDKLEAIAKAFEEKYAPKPKKGKKVVDRRLQDLVDLGDGYDETDPFIDNGEAYDELVPSCMTTKLGGFYINSGHLDFKYLSEDSAEEFQYGSSIKKKKKITRIESDSDSEEEKKRGPKKRKFKDGMEGEKKKRKRIITGPDGEKIHVKRGRKPLDKDKLKKKKMSPTVAELLKQQTASTSTPTHALNGMSEAETASPSEGMIDYKSFDRSTIDSTIESIIMSEAMREDSGSRDGDEERRPVNPDAMVPLPSGLPESLQDTVVKIKQAARESREGKCKFFSPNVNKMLLDIEVSSRQVPCGQRSALYAHLSSFLPCSKETLLKRAKKLRLTQQDDQLKEPITRLKEAINEVMPTLIEMYDAEYQLAVLMRMENKEKGEFEGREEGSTESDDEEKAGQDGNGKKRIMGPRKKFEWDDHLRFLLCDVVRIKMQNYSVAKVRAQSAEEYLKSFLDAEIKPLWPQGWIQTRMLFKESRSAHGPWTNSQKPKKTLLGSKTASSSPTPTPIPFSNSVTPTVPKAATSDIDMIEISSFDGTPDIAKVGAAADQGVGPLKLEDYMELDDVDKMLSSIGKDDNADIPTLLDYADKLTPARNNNSSNLKDSTSSTSKMHSTSVLPGSRIDGGNKSRENPKHNLVSEMLQNPLPSIPASGVSKTAVPAAGTPGNTPAGTGGKETSFMAEFEKHVASLFTNQLKPPHSPVAEQRSNEQTASSKLQSMLTHPNKPHQTVKQFSSNRQHEQYVGDIHKQTSHSNSPKLLSQTSSSQPIKLSTGHMLNSQKKHGQDVKLKSDMSGQQRQSMKQTLSQAEIDQQAVKQIQQHLLQMSAMGKTHSILQSSSFAQNQEMAANPSSKSSQQKMGSSKSSQDPLKRSENSVVQQLFKQPLPANVASQQRQQVQSTTKTSSVTSALRIDTQQGHLPQNQQRNSPQQRHSPAPSQQRPASGQSQRVSPTSSHLSGGSYSVRQSSDTSTKHSSNSRGSLSPGQSQVISRQLSANTDLTMQASKKLAQSIDAHAQMKEASSKSLLERVIEEYSSQIQTGSKTHQQQLSPTSHIKSAYAPSHSSAQGKSPQMILQASTVGGLSGITTSLPSAFSPPQGNLRTSKSQVSTQSSVPGYQSIKLSTLARDSTSPVQFVGTKPSMQPSRSPEQLSGNRSMIPPAHSRLGVSPNVPFTSHSAPPAAHSTTIGTNSTPLLPDTSRSPHGY